MPRRKANNTKDDQIKKNLEYVIAKKIPNAIFQLCTGKSDGLANIINFLNSTSIIELTFDMSPEGMKITGGSTKKCEIIINVDKGSIENYEFFQDDPFLFGARTKNLVTLIKSFSGNVFAMFFMKKSRPTEMVFKSHDLDNDCLITDKLRTMDINAESKEEKEEKNEILAMISIESECLYALINKVSSPMAVFEVVKKGFSIVSEDDSGIKRISLKEKPFGGLRYTRVLDKKNNVISVPFHVKLLTKLLKGLNATKSKTAISLKIGTTVPLSLESNIGNISEVQIRIYPQVKK
jgi:hypothetical protein